MTVIKQKIDDYQDYLYSPSLSPEDFHSFFLQNGPQATQQLEGVLSTLEV